MKNTDKLMKNAKNKMKNNLNLKGKGGNNGGDNCDCPCREYWTEKCTVEYQTECKQLVSRHFKIEVPVSK